MSKDKNTVVVEPTKSIVNDSINRNDLIDYAISKRVEEIKAKKTVAQNEYYPLEKTINEEIKELDKAFKEEQKKAIDKFIDENYSHTISLIETNLKCKHQIVTLDYNGSRHANPFQDLAYFMRLGHNDVLVVFVNEKFGIEKGFRHMGGHGHPMDFLMGLSSMIRIDTKDAKSDELTKLESEIKDKRTVLSDKWNAISEFDKEINAVRNQKDIIKNSLIEQALSKTDEGKGILEVLNNLDLSGGSKMLN